MKPDGKPYDTRRGSARNSPAVLRDDPPRARSTPASSSSANQDPPSSGAIDTLRLFLMSRYSGQDKMLNLENMADDSILKNAGLKAPGEKGAPTNLAKVLWKLVSELFPDVRLRFSSATLLPTLTLRECRSFLSPSPTTTSPPFCPFPHTS